jgi:hypothetical protein
MGGNRRFLKKLEMKRGDNTVSSLEGRDDPLFFGGWLPSDCLTLTTFQNLTRNVYELMKGYSRDRPFLLFLQVKLASGSYRYVHSKPPLAHVR